MLLIDPALPEELLPPGWIGIRAAEFFHRLHTEWERLHTEWDRISAAPR